MRRTRLNGTTVNTVSMDLAYDGLGNITFKTGRGSYAYKSGTATTGCGRVAGPHAVSVIGGKSYCYDLNGNNTEVRSGGTVIRSIVYTGYDLPERIVRNEQGLSATAEFRYGPDRARYKRIDDGAGIAIRTCPTGNADRLFCHGFEEGDANPGAPQGTTTIYVGNVEFITRAGVSLVKRYIGDFLVITTENNADRHDILLRDGLGSIDAIVSETGTIRQRLSFDAHGSRRIAGPAGLPELWNLFDLFTAAAADTRTTTRGYTGHEQLDGVGLIHMNARLYDPEIGRFIQADSMVEPEATQGLNRYSYVLNNPLTFTDPTGQLSFRQVVGLAVGVVAAVLSAGAATPLLSFSYAVGGGFVASYVATGNLKSALWGAVSAAVFWGIGQGFSEAIAVPKPGADNMVEVVFQREVTGSTMARVAAHAGAGGVLAELQGGSFGSAFLCAGLTKWASPAVSSIGMGDGGAPSFGDLAAQTVVAAAVGGTASAITGNGFGSGAQTAAFQYLFNQVASGARPSAQQSNRGGRWEVQSYSAMLSNTFATPQVRLLINQIKMYQPSFTYTTVGGGFTGRDVANLQQALQTLQSMSFCPQGGVYLIRRTDSWQVIYAGRTVDFQARNNQHNSSGRFGASGSWTMDRVAPTNSYLQQRGFEQYFYGLYRPAENLIRPISPSNPYGSAYMRSIEGVPHQ